MTTPASPAETGAGMPPFRAGPISDPRGSVPVALLRITLGVIILATWYDNLINDLYTASGIEGFLNFLSSPDGNDGSLDFFHSFLDSVVRPIAGPFGAIQAVVEFLIGLGLLVGALTRLVSLGAIVFFVSLFLAYFGGEEWIWTYVLLIMSGVTVFAGWGGHKLGLDSALAARFGRSPLGGLLW